MIYLDYQATTPLASEALAAMRPFLEDNFANPHSPSRMGRQAAAAVEAGRTRIAAGFPAGGRLVFTSGATEAVNWALWGALRASPEGRRRIVTVATEHACVLDTARWLAAEGLCELVVLPVDPGGRVDPVAMHAAIDGRTAVVAAMLVNNEIGTMLPMADFAAGARDAGALFLCDAVQGFGRVALPDADLIAVSAHKIHGPKGIGALWLRDGLALPALIRGGGQQDGLRSGTLSPALCAGFGAAADLALGRMDEDRAHVAALAARLLDGLGEGWIVNGGAERWPGNLNLRRERLDAGRLMSEIREVAFSAGSACASGSGRPSHVLGAIGLSDAQARASIRLGFGRYTTPEEVAQAAALIRAGVERQGRWA